MRRIGVIFGGRKGAAVTPLALWPVEGSAPPPPGPFVALLPGAEVPMLPLDLPAGLRGRERLRVARRQVADRLGAEAERLELHPAALPAGEPAWRQVILADRLRLAEWRARVAASGSLCRALLPDYLALPAIADGWTLDWDGANGLRARLGPGEGFAAEPALAVAMLEAALATEPGPPARAVWCGTPEPGVAALLAARGIASQTVATMSGTFAAGEMSLDLAQDSAGAAEALRRALAPWQLPVALALAALLLWSAGVMVETRALRAQARAEVTAAEQIARRALLPAGPILDLRAQIARAVAEAEAVVETGQGAAPLEVLHAAGGVLDARAAKVRTLNLRPGAGLVVDLDLADFAALDALVADLRDAGLAVRVAQSGSGAAGGVQATLVFATAPVGQGRGVR